MNNFSFVDACYRAESNPDYAGNPFVEALPALPEDRVLARELTNMPKFDPAERQWDAATRIQRLDSLQQVLVAFPRVVRLARAMMKMVVSGYRNRKPFSPEDNARLRDLYAAQQKGAFKSVSDAGDAAQRSMALIGASGSGKSSCLRHIAGMFPKAIYHDKLGKWQLPFVFLEMSYDGESVHTLASALFAEFDRLLPDGNLTELYMARKGKGINAEQRLATALKIAYDLGVGQIIIDESQNQPSIGNVAKPGPRRRSAALKSETPLMKLLISASNVSHIPMLFTGTLEFQEKTGGRFSPARRMSGHGSAVWLPLTRHPGSGEKHSEFQILLRALLKYQWVRNPIDYSEEWADVFFYHCQGIPDILVKLFESSQEHAISSGIETLTPELVGRVFEAEFSAANFGIRAVREGNSMMMEVLSDLVESSSDDWASATAQPQFPAPSNLRRKPKPDLAGPSPLAMDAEDLANKMRSAHTVPVSFLPAAANATVRAFGSV